MLFYYNLKLTRALEIILKHDIEKGDKIKTKQIIRQRERKNICY
jgi:hypothetical protein